MSLIQFSALRGPGSQEKTPGKYDGSRHWRSWPRRGYTSFVGGCGRSGTTWVVDVLGLHPVLSPVYETDFVLAVARAICEGRPHEEILGYMESWCRDLPHRPHSKRSYERYVHGPHHVLFDRNDGINATRVLLDRLGRGERGLAAFRDFVEQLFGRHALDLDLLQQVFADMRFIHVVREQEATVRSILGRPWGPADIETARAYHATNVETGRRWGKVNADSYLEVRYEDLARDPRRTVSRILDWLGLDAEVFPFERIVVRKAGG